MSELQTARATLISPTAEQDDAILPAALHMVMDCVEILRKRCAALWKTWCGLRIVEDKALSKMAGGKDAYLDEARREQRRMRGDIDRKALLRNQPRLSHIAETFASSGRKEPFPLRR